ncbi:MAG: family 78 glycoside hydrolase catalytic domain, partial [Promicromonosporaceae bacterium]|nr:family 78 glycoside hydrolase catalytic domain [Promicromonosporaceae bacterium]
MSTAAIPQPKVKQLLPETWTARWITPPQADFQIPAGSRPAHELSTIFELTELPSSAWLFATAAGVYEAFLNGHRVGAQELTPGSTSYDETLYAQVYPVADQLQIGTNELRFVLSDGWYWGQVGAHRSEANWGDHLGILAELQVNTDTGQRAVVVATDDKWLARPSQITRASLMDGQTTDFTAPIAEALPVLVDRVVAPTPTASPAPPVIVAQVLKPKSVTQLSDSEWIVDFGQNASGWVRLSDLGPAGTVTEIDFGEYLNPKGELETSHLDSVRPGEGRCVFRQQDVVISDGTGRVFEPRHTVHGFQFARVRRSGHGFDPNSIEMQVVHTDLAPTGTFECSNADLNRLYEMSRWSFLGNAVDVPTDCPTRERLGWTGDYQVFAPTATRLFDVLGFSRKWLQSVRDDQLPDGRISSFSPDHRRLKGNLGQQMAMMAGAAGWGDAIVYVPWQMYRSYGDTQVLEENWEAMKRWVDWAAETAATKRHQSRVELSDKPAPHEEFIWDGSFHWGEWLEPVPKAADGTRVGEMQVNPHLWFTADKGEVATAYLYLSALRIAEIAWVTGRNSEAAHYAELAAHVRAAWLTEYFDEEGHTKSDTQASYVRALAFDLIPGEMKPAAVARLVELIRAADTHLG